MSGYFYKGRHRVPVEHPTGRTLAIGAAAAALVVPPAVAFAPEAHAGPPGGWGPIIDCESGGRTDVVNSIGAAGLFQFMPGTWASVGGTGSAADASVEEQYMRAERLYAQRGTQPWNASKHCWQGRTGDADIQPSPSPVLAPAPAREGGKHRAPEATNGRAADGAGTYVCGPSTYLFEACDPGMDGQTVAYPLYDGKHSSGVVKAASVSSGKHRAGPPADLDRRDSNGHGTFVCDDARLGYDTCDPEDLGQRVSYPAFD